MSSTPQETIRRNIGSTNANTPSSRITSPFNLKWFGDDLAAAYTALPAGGGEIFLGGNITISSSLVIDITKPLTLNLNGFTITLSHITGPGLYLKSGYSLRTTPVRIKNGVIQKGGTPAAVIGLKMLYTLYGGITDLRFSGFSTVGSTGVLFDFVEDYAMDRVVFSDNATALELTNATNENRFQNCKFQENSRALYIHGLSVTPGVIVGGGSDGNTFSSCLFQSNTGVHTIDITADALASSGPYSNKFDACWFEGNGDGSGNSREFYLFSGAGLTCIGTTFDKVIFNTGMTGGGEAVEWAGTGFLGYDVFISVSFSAADGEPAFPVNTTVIDGTRVIANGIQFRTPAVAPANSKTLYDYDQGTWTGALVPQTSGTITMNADTGKYTKIGRQVTVTGIFNAASVAAPVGALRLTGLPFTNGAALSNRASVTVTPLTLAAGATTSIVGRILESTNYITLQKYAAGVLSDLAGDMIGAGSGFEITATYFVD